MKTIDEMMKVMQAYKEGKTIERKIVDCGVEKWIVVTNPVWDWYESDYRIKAEPEYVPYDSVLEIERDKWVKFKVENSWLCRILKIHPDNNKVFVGGIYLTLEELFEKFEYEDGSPCGKKVEE